MPDGVYQNMDRGDIFQLLEDPDTHGFTVLSICLRQYGDEYFELDSLEVYSRLKEDFLVTLHEALENKLQAITVAMTTTEYETDPSVFDSVVKTLSSGDPDIEDGSDFADMDEILWSDYEISLARPGDENFEFSPAVQAYRKIVADSVETNDGNTINDLVETLEDQKEKLFLELRKAGFEISGLPELEIPET